MKRHPKKRSPELVRLAGCRIARRPCVTVAELRARLKQMRAELASGRRHLLGIEDVAR